jgi:hypothetical protein
MDPQRREYIEQSIGQLLLEQWDPLGVHDDVDRKHEYTPYAHELYTLLARGASDVQITRHLHRIELEELHRPELTTRDLTPLIRDLRSMESSL